MPAKNLLQSIQEHVGKRTFAERPFAILQTNIHPWLTLLLVIGKNRVN